MAQAAPLANGSRRKDYLAEDKWHEIYVNQLSFFINLVLGMATAAVGFCISYLVGHPHSAPDFATFRIFTIVFMFSIGFGVLCTLIRLVMFDKRRRDARYKGMRKWVRWLTILQSLCFFGGALVLSIHFVI
jgi:peptidoglycan/LPS O-acetylase OafA/YrhL